MAYQLPVVWAFHDVTVPGRLDLAGGRLTLTSRGRSFAFPLAQITASAVERAPDRRLRGLPVLSVRLANGDGLRIASLGGVGSLHELATVLAPSQAVGA